ncbi:MAG: peptidoglycan-associated lipoprotein Pal [Candidatus Sumerlaeota bacterium]|nr:peptidoglycan-associated lipoprotein Pal [Candidatus Sumerlaeota bacterium]
MLLKRVTLRRYFNVAALLAIAVMFNGCAGCRKDHKAEEPGIISIKLEEPKPPVKPQTGDEIGTPIRQNVEESKKMGRIYFDYDKSNIRPDQIPMIDGNAKYLLENPALHIQIEGHCDERGTREYNYSLGERRAKMVVDYLAKKGVSRDRLHPISYGKDRPVALGHNEEAWKQNRRAMFMEFVGGK